MGTFVRNPVEIYTPKYISTENNIRFKIPLYQRLFTWKEKNINGLLEDLLNHFRNSKTSQPYYLGIITQISEKPESNDGYLIVLDGQQRITVLMLLAAYFSQYYDTWKRFLFQGNGYELSRPSAAGNGADPGEDNAGLLRLWPFARDDERARLIQLIYQHENALKNKEKTLLEAGYETIAQFISTNFPDDKENERKEFSDNIFNHLTLLVTNLASSYLTKPEYLNRYFEIMNSNYKNLEQHEVLKVHLATGAQNARELFSLWEICENFSETVIELLKKRQKKHQTGNQQETSPLSTLSASTSLRNYVKSLVEELKNSHHLTKNTTASGDISTQNLNDSSAKKKKIADIVKAYYNPASKVKSGGRSIITFPQFLLLALDIFLDVENGIPLPREQQRKHYESASLLETFKKGSKCFIPDRLEDFYTFLLRLRALLDIYVIRRKEDSEENYSLLLGKLKEEDGKKEASWEPKNAYCRLAQYQAMLDAALPDSFYTWLKPYLLDLYTCHFKNNDGFPAESDDAAAFLLGKLKAWDNQRVLIGDKHREAKSLFAVLEPARLTYSEIDRYWFWRLDYYLWEGCEGSTKELFGRDHLKAVRAYRMRTNRSIEHLYPQNPQYRLQDEQEPDLNSFGNLAMISSAFNSQQSNESVGVKFERLKTHIDRSALQSLKLLAMYQAAKREGRNWTREAAKEHEARMIALLLTSFNGESDVKRGETNESSLPAGEHLRAFPRCLPG